MQQQAWHVTVTAPDDGRGGRRYRRRFRFITHDEAWECYAAAIRNGFEAEGDVVEVVRARERKLAVR